jgi:biotin carboxyl carrier protein
MSKAALDASILLKQLRHSAWRDMYVRTAGYELYIAKPGGASNPMRRAPASAVPASAAQFIVAPHIGTVAWIEVVGAAVTPGAIVARIEVLGTLIDIGSEFAGRINAVAAPIGTLVEFGTTIATIVATRT